MDIIQSIKDFFLNTGGESLEDKAERLEKEADKAEHDAKQRKRIESAKRRIQTSKGSKGVSGGLILRNLAIGVVFLIVVVLLVYKGC